MSRVNTRRIREGLGFSLHQWARELGVGRRTVMRWENDGVDPSPLALQQLKRYQSRLDERHENGEQAASPAMPDRMPKRHKFEPMTESAPKRFSATGVVPGGRSEV